MHQVSILKFKRIDGKNQLRAFADVSIGEIITVYGVRLMQDPKGFWVGFPQSTYQSNGQTKYAPIVNFCEEIKVALRQALSAAFKESE